MCNYLQRSGEPNFYGSTLEQHYGLGFLTEHYTNKVPTPVEHFRSAQYNTAHKITKLLIIEAGEFKLVDAIWWYHCTVQDNQVIVQPRYGHNARHLNYPVWREALYHRRGIAFVTGFGESIQKPHPKTQKLSTQYYLHQAQRVFALGVLYQQLAPDFYSCTVITRHPHPRMKNYHDKAMIFFLPSNPKFIMAWLSPGDPANPLIRDHLVRPKLYPDLYVTAVKSYQSQKQIKQGIVNKYLESDLTYTIK